jgi:hypothetical protein
MDTEIIVLDQLDPPSLSHVQLSLSENILKAFVISADVTSITNEVVSPSLEGMNYGG